jgi:hypothetical protein
VGCGIHTTFWSQNLKGIDHSEGLGADGKIILEWILGKEGAKVWTRFIWLKIRTSGGLLCEHGNVSSCYVKGGKFLD